MSFYSSAKRTVLSKLLIANALSKLVRLVVILAMKVELLIITLSIMFIFSS